MRNLRTLLAILIVGAVSIVALRASAEDPKNHPVGWQAWGKDVFERAGRENRYIVLHMAAVWCHWCHVMEGTTYRDPAVLKLIGEKFIPVRVDQDSHPELSYRYEAWGWPATIMFDKDGNEIFRRQGYQPPDLFAKLLAAVIEDPSALPSGGLDATADVAVHALDAATRKRLEASYREVHDAANGGFGRVHRFTHADTLEFALDRGRPLKRNADAALYAGMYGRTLKGARRLIDPVWGGLYQYSDRLDWSSPHYEKLINIQRDGIRAWVLAWQIDGAPGHLDAARATARWLMERMRVPAGSPDAGAFYVSQDADLDQRMPGTQFYALDAAARAALGREPAIDHHLYARETAWAAASLATLYDATGERAVLDAAIAALDWTVRTRRAANGAFGHARASDEDIHLGDTVAVGEAALALYRSTGERRWLTLAIEVARAIDRHFQGTDGGFVVRQPDPAAIGALRKPVRQIDENVATTRFLNLASRYAGDAQLMDGARHGMAWLAALAKNDVVLPGILLADAELAREPVHVTIVGRRDNPAAAALHAAARRYPTRYLRIEWIDRAEGPMPNPDVEYPDMP